MSSRPTATTDQMFFDVAVASTRSVVAVGREDIPASSCRFLVYRPAGSIAGGLSFPSSFGASFQRVVADAIGGFCAVGTFGVGAGEDKIAVLRGSTLSGGGGFASLYSQLATSETGGSAVAARGTTIIAVGSCRNAGTGMDQAVLAYVW